MRILVAEDHPELGPDLKTTLENNSYVVDLVTSGDDALAIGLTMPYDLIILDILLPGLSGLEVCQQLRLQNKQTPILFLTALGNTDQRIQGLNMGGDDYMTKPFTVRELEARVRALIRRVHSAKTAQLSFMDLTLNTRTHEAWRGKRHVPLTQREYALLEYLMYHPRQVLSRLMIAEHVWDDDAEHLSNIIEVYIRYLRTKLCAEGEPDLIQTIRGSGYQLKEPEA
jgi:DNA-binding response OmpR family regulator